MEDQDRIVRGFIDHMNIESDAGVASPLTRGELLILLMLDDWLQENKPEYAAAPKLLEALKAVQPTFYGMLCEHWGHPDDWPKDRQGAVVYQGILDAIAEATGE